MLQRLEPGRVVHLGCLGRPVALAKSLLDITPQLARTILRLRMGPEAERALRKQYGADWSTMGQGQKDALIMANRSSGTRGKRRELVSTVEEVAVQEHLGLNRDVPFLNFRRFREKVGGGPGVELEWVGGGQRRDN